MGTLGVKIYGTALVAEFAKRHAASRKPLQRFLTIVEAASWPHLPAAKEVFPSIDYAPFTGTLIFDIAGNKYRLVARVDFDEQMLYIQKVMTHAEYDREDF
jgi:mRNA interferase HigB